VLYNFVIYTDIYKHYIPETFGLIVYKMRQQFETMLAWPVSNRS